MSRSRRSSSFWIGIVGGPALAAVFGVLGFLGSLGDSKLDATVMLSSYYLSVVTLAMSSGTACVLEAQKVARTAADMRRSAADTAADMQATAVATAEAVKGYLHVTKCGTVRSAWIYLISRLPALDEVKNTSFNLPDEEQRPKDRLYDLPEYVNAPAIVAAALESGLLWTDLGDALATERLRRFAAAAAQTEQGDRYRYRLIEHREPQMNFSLLTYKTGEKEVLFNWDFRSPGVEPTVLLSRDEAIVHMFAVHYELLLKRGSPDHDSTATRSTPRK